MAESDGFRQSYDLVLKELSQHMKFRQPGQEIAEEAEPSSESERIYVNIHDIRPPRTTNYKRLFEDSLTEPLDTPIFSNRHIVSVVRGTCGLLSGKKKKSLCAPDNQLILSAPWGLDPAGLAHLAARVRRCRLLRLDPAWFEGRTRAESAKIARELGQFLGDAAASVVLFDAMDFVVEAGCELAERMRESLFTHWLPRLAGLGHVLLVWTTRRPARPRHERLRELMFFRLELPTPRQRKTLLKHHLEHFPHALSKKEVKKVAERTVYHTPGDLEALLKYAYECRLSARLSYMDVKLAIYKYGGTVKENNREWA